MVTWYFANERGRIYFWNIQFFSSLNSQLSDDMVLLNIKKQNIQILKHIVAKHAQISLLVLEACILRQVQIPYRVHIELHLGPACW